MQSTHSSPKCLPLFVYGTLRPSGANFDQYLHGHIKRILPATVQGQLYWITPGNYPYLLTGYRRVVGELIEIVPKDWRSVIAAIDQLEEYDARNESQSWYLRRLTEAILDNGQIKRCWTYYWNRPNSGRLIESGDWLNR